MPVLKTWNLDVAWLEPKQAKNGQQARELAEGVAAVVINTACIGHAASGRVSEAARSAQVAVIDQTSRGVGSMLMQVRGALARLSAPPAPRKASGARARHKLLPP
jgi:hypothetical protein